MYSKVSKNNYGKFCLETTFNQDRVDFNLVDSRYFNLEVGEEHFFEKVSERSLNKKDRRGKEIFLVFWKPLKKR